MFIFLDTETTGTGHDGRLCQIAFKPENGQAASGLFNPGKLIFIDAKPLIIQRAEGQNRTVDTGIFSQYP
jgi:hypothetical protein